MTMVDQGQHICRGSLLTPHVCGTCGKDIAIGPGKILLAPPELPVTTDAYEALDVQPGWWCVVYPATPFHHALAKKMAETKPGQLLPLTVDEMALLMEFMPWPRR